MKRTFTKPATTHAEQIALLRQRGMLVEDEAQASFYLQHLNYYRLGAYWLPFEADHGAHAFSPGTRFTEVLNLYLFDRELRLLVLDAIERIEVSVRSQWAYQLAHLHGPHAHLEQSLARDSWRWKINFDALAKDVQQRSDEVFIQHLTQNYEEVLPPVWAVCEVMSLGLLSRWYGNLKPMATRRAIASVYQIDQRVMGSWLHHLTHIRNTCAHHSRLWNREFTITPEMPRSKPARLASEFIPGSRRLYNSLLIITHFMDLLAPDHFWKPRLKGLVTSHAIPLRTMGFPDDWKQRAIWQEGEK